eukprot:PITA_16531
MKSRGRFRSCYRKVTSVRFHHPVGARSCWYRRRMGLGDSVLTISEINSKSGYHQVPIEPFDVWKTTFKAKEGIFEWFVMPFELRNAPATFMRLMYDILWPFNNSFIVVYLDDILIFNQSWEENLQHIRQVLQTMQQHKLCANLEKCTFGMTQVQYLGYVIDEQGVHVDPTKIQIIRD